MHMDMTNLLNDAASETARFLSNALPPLNAENWWERRVLQFLTEGQRRAVERNNIIQLTDLDLSALLHTLDNNWPSLEDTFHFDLGARNFVKEMRAVRNRWSHMPAVSDLVPDDVYRDLDTLERFLTIVETPNDVLGKVREQRLAVAMAMIKAYSVEVSNQTVVKTIELPKASTEQIATTAEPEPVSPSCPVCGSQMALRTARAGPYAGNHFWGCREWSVTGCGGIINVPKTQDTESEPPPTCPVCRSSMVLRTARTGPYAGNQFWGCSEWGITGCGGLRNIPENPATADTDDLPF